MTPVEIGASVAVVGLVGSWLGWIIRGTKMWSRRETELGAVVSGHEKLKQAFVAHKDDRAIHIDPIRDSDSMKTLKETMAENHKTLVRELGEIKAGCASRLKSCSEHFEALAVSVAKGRAPQEDD